MVQFYSPIPNEAKPTSKLRGILVAILVILIVIILIIILIRGNGSNFQLNNSQTDETKILESLKTEINTAPVIPAEQAKILESLKQEAPSSREISASEQAKILESLKNQ